MSIKNNASKRTAPIVSKCTCKQALESKLKENITKENNILVTINLSNVSDHHFICLIHYKKEVVNSFNHFPSKRLEKINYLIPDIIYDRLISKNI